MERGWREGGERVERGWREGGRRDKMGRKGEMKAMKSDQNKERDSL